MDKEDVLTLEVFLYKAGYTLTETASLVGYKTAKVSKDLKKELVEMRTAGESRLKKKTSYGDFPKNIKGLFNLYNISREEVEEYYQRNPAPKKPVAFVKKEGTSEYLKNDVRATVVEMKELVDSLIENTKKNTNLDNYSEIKNKIIIKVKDKDERIIKISEGNQQEYVSQLKKLALGTLRDAILEIEYVYDNEFNDDDFLRTLLNYVGIIKQYVKQKFPELVFDMILKRQKKSHTFSLKFIVGNTK